MNRLILVLIAVALLVVPVSAQDIQATLNVTPSTIKAGEIVNVHLNIKGASIESPSPVDVVLLMDRSGSMKDWIPTYYEKKNVEVNDLSVDKWKKVGEFKLNKTGFIKVLTWVGIGDIYSCKDYTKYGILIKVVNKDTGDTYVGKVRWKLNEVKQTWCSKSNKEAKIKYEVKKYNAPAGNYEVYIKLGEKWRNPPSGVTVWDMGYYIWADEHERKIDAAKSASKAFVDLLRDNDRAGVVVFPKYSSRYRGGDILQALTTDKNTVKSAIDSIWCRGYTPLGDGLKVAIRHLTNYGRDNAFRAIIVLSDGYWNTGSAPPVDVAKIAKKKGIVIFTIGYGVRVNEEVLRKIAEITGGEYYYAITSEDVKQIYKKIAKKMVKISASNIKVEMTINNSEVLDASVPTDLGEKLTWKIGTLSENDTWSVVVDIKPNVNPSKPITVEIVKGVKITYKIGNQIKSLTIPSKTVTVEPSYPKIVVDNEYSVEEGKLLKFNVSVLTATIEEEKVLTSEFRVFALPTKDNRVLITWFDPPGIKKTIIYEFENNEWIKRAEIPRGYHGRWLKVDSGEHYFKVVAVLNNGKFKTAYITVKTPSEWVRIWPSQADVSYCYNCYGKRYPATGPNSATWFRYGWCGVWKVFDVEPNKPVALVLWGDECPRCPGCILGDIRLYVYDYVNGKWTNKKFISKPIRCGFAVHYITPKGSKIKVVDADGWRAFYIAVYQLENGTPSDFVKYSVTQTIKKEVSVDLKVTEAPEGYDLVKSGKYSWTFLWKPGYDFVDNGESKTVKVVFKAVDELGSSDEKTVNITVIDHNPIKISVDKTVLEVYEGNRTENVTVTVNDENYIEYKLKQDFRVDALPYKDENGNVVVLVWYDPSDVVKEYRFYMAKDKPKDFRLVYKIVYDPSRWRVYVYSYDYKTGKLINSWSRWAYKYYLTHLKKYGYHHYFRRIDEDGTYYFKVEAVLGNGKIYNSTVGVKFPTGWERIWPSDADVRGCRDCGWRWYPATGPNSATWFHYGGCGNWKVFNVEPNKPVKIYAYGDGYVSCPGCCLRYINFDVYEYVNGKWRYVGHFHSDRQGHGEFFDITPKGNKIKIVGGWHYVMVFQRKTDGNYILDTATGNVEIDLTASIGSLVKVNDTTWVWYWTPGYDVVKNNESKDVIVTFTAEDSLGAKANKNITIIVNNVNRAPKITVYPEKVTVNEGEEMTPITIKVENAIGIEKVLPYWIEDYKGYKVWVKVPKIPAGGEIKLRI